MNLRNRVACIILFLYTFNCFPQPSPTSFYATSEDSLPIQIFVGENEFKFVNKENKDVYDLKFNAISEVDDYGFYKATAGNEHYFLKPDEAFIFKYPKELQSLHDFSEAIIERTFYTKTYVIDFKKRNYFMDFRGIIHKKIEALTINKVGKSSAIVYEQEDNEQTVYLERKNTFFDDKTFTNLIHLESLDDYESLFITTEKNGLKGVVSSLGFYVLEPLYKSIKELFIDNSFEKIYVFFEIKEKNLIAYFNSKGDKIIDFEHKKFIHYYDDFEYSAVYELLGFFPISKNKIGFYDLSGRKIIEPKYDKLDIVNFGEMEFSKEDIPILPKEMPLVKKSSGVYPYKAYYLGIDTKNNTISYIAPSGQVLETYKKHTIYEYTKSGFIIFSLIEDPYTLGILGPGAHILVYPEYDQINISDSAFILIKDSNENTEKEYIVVNLKGESFIQDEIQYASFTDELNPDFLILQLKNKNIGLIELSKSNKEKLHWRIPAKYNDLFYLFNSYKTAFFAAEKDGKYGVISDAEKIKLNFEYTNITHLKGDDIAVTKDESETTKKGYAIYNSSFNPCSDFIFDRVENLTAFGPSFYNKNKIYYVYKDGKMGIYG
jgi:hypothetical protein